MIHLLCKEKYQSDGRSFGTAADPIDYSVVLLSTEGVLPSSYTEIEGQTSTPYDFAPGSLLIDTANRLKYIYDGQQWQYWAAAGEGSSEESSDVIINDVVYLNENENDEFTYNELVNYINQGKKIMLITTLGSICKLISLYMGNYYTAEFENAVVFIAQNPNDYMTKQGSK